MANSEEEEKDQIISLDPKNVANDSMNNLKSIYNNNVHKAFERFELYVKANRDKGEVIFYYDIFDTFIPNNFSSYSGDAKRFVRDLFINDLRDHGWNVKEYASNSIEVNLKSPLPKKIKKNKKEKGNILFLYIAVGLLLLVVLFFGICNH